MSLAALNWRRCSRTWVAILYNSPRRFLDALFGVMGSTVTTYYDNSSRTPGSGSAVLASREQDAGVTEAVYWDYVTDALNHKGIIAGQGIATKTPTMASPDSFAANRIIMSVIKNAGSYTNWDAANPYGSGSAFGYWRTGDTGSPPVVLGMDFYESQEAAHLTWMSSGGGCFGGMTGAHLDPQSTHANDAESDGRTYGMMTSADGVNADWVDQSFEQSNSPDRTTDHQAVDGVNHHGILNPGLGTLDTLYKTATYPNFGQTFGVTPGGYVAGLTSIPFRRIATRNFRGSSRQWGPTKAVPVGSVFQSAGADVAYAAWGNTIYGIGSCAIALTA